MYMLISHELFDLLLKPLISDNCSIETAEFIGSQKNNSAGTPT